MLIQNIQIQYLNLFSLFNSSKSEHKVSEAVNHSFIEFEQISDLDCWKNSVFQRKCRKKLTDRRSLNSVKKMILTDMKEFEIFFHEFCKH